MNSDERGDRQRGRGIKNRLIDWQWSIKWWSPSSPCPLRWITSLWWSYKWRNTQILATNCYVTFSITLTMSSLQECNHSPVSPLPLRLPSILGGIAYRFHASLDPPNHMLIEWAVHESKRDFGSIRRKQPTREIFFSKDDHDLLRVRLPRHVRLWGSSPIFREV